MPNLRQLLSFCGKEAGLQLNHAQYPSFYFGAGGMEVMSSDLPILECGSLRLLDNMLTNEAARTAAHHLPRR
jgi:hypothetical protein